MPTDDLQVLVAGTAPAPAGFLVPGNGQIRPKAMNAVFDGTSAATAFLPTLEIVSDAGIVVARCPASSVAAGGSAEVSWFPHVAAASSAGASIVGTFGVYNSAGVSTAAGNNLRASWVYQFGAALLDLTIPTTPTVFVDGLYWIGVTFRSNATWTAGRGFECEFGAAPTGPQASAIAIADSFLHVPEGFVAQTLRLKPGDLIHADVTNYDSGNRTLYIQEADVVLLAS